MINSFNEILEKAKVHGKKKISVACPEHFDVLSAVSRACRAGLVDGFLVGNKKLILDIINSEEHLMLDSFEIIDVSDKAKASEKAVELVSNGSADILMKGIVDTATLLKAVLNRDIGLRSGKVLSHISVMELPNYPRLLSVTDMAINIAPGLSEKKVIIENAVKLNISLGNAKPKVACLCAIENVTPKMIATVEADKLKQMNQNGEISDCIVEGPLALDNAVSERSAKIKNIESPVAGHADILLCPDIEAGNILYKALSFLAYAKSGGIVLGATAPIVLTSRADSEDVKFNSIALALLST